MEVLFKIVLGFILNYPGAYLRWLFFKEKAYDEYLEDISINYIISIIVIALILTLYNIFIKT
ncbi:hypothetical protein [Olleya sp. Bg11-27]|uniref:hypothetical protein n=1 Tax=Olleya sp. Bg11-27 TaxID=2058135 RepID=UPI000C31730E|nr:hypothetical protein [Olleya sp. Bg11-27]AUC77564.1 hypothetical protein CW732_18515 [Olleya sp. Bg11-27]